MNDFSFSIFRDKLQCGFDTKIFNYVFCSKQGFFFQRESTVTSFSFCVSIVALFCEIKIQSHLFGSSPNQTSAGMRPSLWLCCEFTVSFLFNSLLMSWGKNAFQISMSRGSNFMLFCNPSQKLQKVTSMGCVKRTYVINPLTLENIS